MEYLEDFRTPDIDAEPFAPTQRLWTIDDPPVEEMDVFSDTQYYEDQDKQYFSIPEGVVVEHQDMQSSGVHYNMPYDRVAQFGAPQMRAPSHDDGVFQHGAPPSLHTLAHQQQLPPSARMTKPPAPRSHVHRSSQMQPSSRASSEAPQPAQYAYYRQKVPPSVPGLAVAGSGRQPAEQPVAGPSRQPTAGPSRQPTAGPSRQPTAGPSRQPVASQQSRVDWHYKVKKCR
jgi:hypothetical protein